MILDLVGSSESCAGVCICAKLSVCHGEVWVSLSCIIAAVEIEPWLSSKHTTCFIGDGAPANHLVSPASGWMDAGEVLLQLAFRGKYQS